MSTAIDILAQSYIAKHPKETARYVERLDKQAAADFLSSYPESLVQSVWYFLTPANKEHIFLLLPDELATAILMSLDIAPAAALISRFSTEKQELYLAKLNAEYANQIKNYMAYPDDVAGGLMDKVAHTYYESMTAAQALAQIKKNKLTSSLYVYVVNNEMKLTRRINIQQLIVADDQQLLSSMGTHDPISLSGLSPKSEISACFDQYKLDSLPVVDAHNHMIGIVYASKLIELLREDATSNIQTMVGASAEEKALSPSSFTVKKRLPWLFINLLTAFAAASVVGLFEGLISKFTALAVLMPVVAGQSGNAGAQALAVTMRGLALREVTITHWLKVMTKELLAGVFIGVAVAVACAFLVYLWSKSFGLAVVLAVSMTLSVTIACISGALVPMVLKKLGQDPAQSSSIILTTVTDIAGFFSFLGIALLLSAYL